jgi:hypothetical protein
VAEHAEPKIVLVLGPDIVLRTLIWIVGIALVVVCAAVEIALCAAVFWLAFVLLAGVL